MEKEHWGDLIETLHKWRLHRITAAFIEALGPLSVVGAQVMYLGQPILSTFISSRTASDLAGILEDPETTQLFVQSLRSYESK